MARKPLIAGNWKMNLNHLEAIALVQKLAFALPEKYYDKVEVAVLPPFTAHPQRADADRRRRAADGVRRAGPVAARRRAPTPVTCPGAMLAKLGCRYVVVGHSERREYHGETDELVNRKVRAALRNGIAPILCVGEGLDVREAGDHVEHTAPPSSPPALGEGDRASRRAKIVIAYEPVWAIGTGRVASPADAQEVCAAIRERARREVRRDERRGHPRSSTAVR